MVDPVSGAGEQAESTPSKKRSPEPKGPGKRVKQAANDALVENATSSSCSSPRRITTEAPLVAKTVETAQRGTKRTADDEMEVPPTKMQELRLPTNLLDLSEIELMRLFMNFPTTVDSETVKSWVDSLDVEELTKRKDLDTIEKIFMLVMEKSSDPEVFRLSLGAKEKIDGAEDKLVDGFIKKLQYCGWEGDATKLKRSIKNGHLNLSRFSIIGLPPEIGNLHRLQIIILNGTQITSLPSEIGNLHNLRMLNLSGTRITIVPSCIINLLNLQELYLSYTQIRTLPSWIENLPKLKIVSLERTQITTLPPEIGNLSNLIDLNLDGTRITTVLPWIKNLLNLQKLNLRDTQITSLPGIENLLELKTLNLRNTSITTIPCAIKELRQITELDLTGCPIVAQGDETNLGRRELRAHFGDRVIFGDVTPATMPSNTTKEEVYRALDAKPLHVNREQLKNATLPEIPDTTIADGGEFLEQFNTVISQLNFDNEMASDYLSHQLLASDFASEARDPDNSNWDKIQSNVFPRLTGYFKTLYDLPLESGEASGWQMNDDKKPALKKALSYILNQLGSLEDPEQCAMLFTQLVHGMLHCPTGQKEGIDTVIIALLDAKTMRASDIETQVHNIMAIKKAEFFKTAILTKGAENSQNVHLISSYEERLKEELGLSNILEYNERMGIMGTDPFNNNPNNVLKIFYDLVTPERMAQWLLEKTESSNELALHKELGELEKKQAQFTAPRTWEARLAAAPVEQHAAIQAQIDSLQRVSGVDVSDKISELKARIKINAQFKPITTQAILTYLIDKKIVDTTQDTWWQEYFSADPAVDETAAVTHQGAMTLLTKLGYVIGS